MTYGKVFATLYSGSMVGSGLAVYALMPYIITKAMPDKRHGGYIELNPVVISAIFGTTPDVVEKAIEYLCQPDKHTSTPGDDGRRLVRLGPFSYRVVNYAHYKAIKNEEDRREQNRVAQENHRQRLKERAEKRKSRGPARQRMAPDQSGTMNARLIEDALGRGDTVEADRLQKLWDDQVAENCAAQNGHTPPADDAGGLT